MAELRVQCPDCQSKMKLTATVDKVRCPKCDTVFAAAQHQLQPARTAERSTSANRRKPVAATFHDDFEAEADDQWEPVQKKSRSKKSPSRSQNKKAPKPGAIQAEQLRKFGFTMVLFGIGAFVLPLLGLQIKGLHRMPPEMQALGGVCFLILGAIILLLSFKDHFGARIGSTVESGFKIVKWGAIGLFALVIGVPVLLLMFRLALNAVAGDANDEHERIAQQLAQPRDIPQIPVPQRPANIGAPRSIPSTIPASTPVTGSTNTAPSPSPFADVGETAEASEPASPFLDVTPSVNGNAANMNTSPPNTETTPSSGGPVRFSSSANNNESRASLTVGVVLKGYSQRDVLRHMRDLRMAAETFRMRVIKIEDQLSRIEFDGVKNTQTFADRISFGKVTQVNAESNEITIEP